MGKKMNRFFVALGMSLMLGSFVMAQTVIALRDNTPLRTDNGNGGVEWAVEVLAGQKLELLDTEPVQMDLVTSTETTPSIAFYKVRYQGKNYFIRTSEAAPASQAAVITEDAVLFTRPRLSDFRNALLEAGSIIVAGNQVSHAGIDFTEVFFFDTAAWQIRSRYVIADMISAADSDVEAIQLLQKATTMQDKGVQQELLHSAMNLNTSEKITELVRDFVQELEGSTITHEDIITLEAMQLGLISTGDGDNVNVRSFPGTGAGSQVVGQLSQGTLVEIIAVTSENQTIDGIEAPWYQVKATTGEGETLEEGWVFGHYVKTELE